MPKMLTYIAGVSYKEGAFARLQSLKSGHRLSLVREPQNQYDKNAVAVFDTDGLHLGYVPAPDAGAITWVVALDLNAVATLSIGGGSSSLTITWDNPK